MVVRSLVAGAHLVGDPVSVGGDVGAEGGGAGRRVRHCGQSAQLVRGEPTGGVAGAAAARRG